MEIFSVSWLTVYLASSIQHLLPGSTWVMSNEVSVQNLVAMSDHRQGTQAPFVT